MTRVAQLLAESRAIQKALRNDAFRFIAGNLFNAGVRKTRHFREWFRCPMNYARIMELPLTMILLKARPSDRILDVSSPKLLSLFYARAGFKNVVAADLEKYFVGDFSAYRQYARIGIDTVTFDAAKKIPFPDCHFDRIFSISALEHIPGDGDRSAIREMLRVLKATGTIVVTLPVYSSYVEEWVSAKNFYWRAVPDPAGRIFYQRRYDREALLSRFSPPNGRIDEIVLVAEKPIAPARLDQSGMMLHNSYYIKRVPLAILFKVLGRLLPFVPFTGYAAENVVSRKCHYLTADWGDPNIRQVVVKISKVVPA